MKIRSTTILKLNGLLLLAAFAFSSCGKSGNSENIIDHPTGGGGSSSDPAQYGTPYTGVPNSSDIVMYEVNERTFSPANFTGVSARLDSIKALGVNVIWLMPTYPIGILKSAGSPYCVMDYEGVNTDFGTIDDLRALVAKAHSLGMAVIFDWEANDTSWDNAWINNNPAYYQHDASGNIKQLSTYTDVAALDFTNNSMRLAMIKAMKYWIFKANIDGYRCDFADNAPADFWSQAIDTLNNITTHKLIYLAEGTNTSEITSGFQLGYAFSYYGTIKGVFDGSSAAGLISTNTAEALPSPGLKLRYITNHDVASSDGSTTTLYGGKAGAEAAFVIAAYMGGVPLIYSSQEVAYTNKINFFNLTPVDYTANPDVVAVYKKILAFRASHSAVKTGTLTTYSDANISAFEKVSGADDVAVMINTRNSTQTFTLPAAVQNTTWKNGYTGATVSLTTSYTFQPYEYLVLSKN